jgi:hypothetical protein
MTGHEGKGCDRIPAKPDDYARFRGNVLVGFWMTRFDSLRGRIRLAVEGIRMHFVIDAGGLLAAAAVGTAVFVPLTYVIRSSNQAPLRGIWLPIVAVWDLALCLLGWTNAWRDELQRKPCTWQSLLRCPWGNYWHF